MKIFSVDTRCFFVIVAFICLVFVFFPFCSNLLFVVPTDRVFADFSFFLVKGSFALM